MVLTQQHSQRCTLDIHFWALYLDTTSVIHVDRYQFAHTLPFGIVHRHIRYCIHSIVTFPICTVVPIALDTTDDLIDMTDFDFELDCNYTDRNRRACSGSHSNPSYMNIGSVHLLRNSHFEIKSTAWKTTTKI